MRASRFLPLSLVALFIFISFNGPMQMIERAYANCCSIWTCNRWWSVAYGEIELQSPTAKVTIGKQSYVMDVSQEVEDAFKKSKMTHAYGFIVLRGEGDTTPKKPLITAFVPGDRENHDNKISAEKSVIFYNKLFVEEIAEYGGKKK